MTTLYKLRDYRETVAFEREHPKELRWDERYKLFMLEENKQCQGIWLKDKKDLIAEIIMTWHSDNVAYIESITVLPAHQSKGLGYQMVTSAIDWASHMKYECLMGAARKGRSWHIFENLGAEPVMLHKNWYKTGEDYMLFKMEV